MPRPSTRSTALAVLVWLVCSLVMFAAFFFNSSREAQIAGHNAVIKPLPSRFAVLHLGPVLPDVRLPSGKPLGVEVTLGSTSVASLDDLLTRYAVVASHPKGQVAIIERSMKSMAISAALRGAVVGAVVPLLWFLVGHRRRRELLSRLSQVQVIGVCLALVVATLAIWQPWVANDSKAHWVRLGTFVDVPIPKDLQYVEINSDVTTEQYKKLVTSALSIYDKSEVRYSAAIKRLADVEGIRVPSADETVAILLTDRHDNIGMDAVSRAVADKAKASVVFDGGDDTSTGGSWEAFSLDSLDASFKGFEKYAVAGNHDHGGFVTKYLKKRGWRNPALTLIEGPGGSTLTGLDDPRSSGLGDWRKEKGVTFKATQERIRKAVCEADKRVNTLLVHDANMGRLALDSGCVDLVIGGHVHVRIGPQAVLGSNGQVGYTYTNGTSGGAAYAIALGRIRRDATLTLITYRDGRPVGIQWVVLETNETFQVGEYQELVYSAQELPAHPELTVSPSSTPTPPP
ncbi:MAG: metallophosphoesterase [Marmoricola sp.]